MTRTARTANRFANLATRHERFVLAARSAELDERQYRRERERYRTAARTAGRAGKALGRGN